MSTVPRLSRLACAWALGAIVAAAAPRPAAADGMMVAPSKHKEAPYKGSVEERAQEALIIFQGSDEPGGATEDLILKVSVRGEVGGFAWIVPFPQEPQIAREDPKLFEELFSYVQAQSYRPAEKLAHGEDKQAAPSAMAEPRPVEVLSRKTVGTYDTAVVRENVPGALNRWLEAEGYQTLPAGGDDLVGFYRRKGYVFACIKVSEAALAKDEAVDIHPLRFSFKTGGRDGIFYPMRMTGLQQEPFDVNLYVFYRAWLNDKLSKFGYVHRGFRLHYRDWDTKECVPNGGKPYSAPEGDPLLGPQAARIPTLAKLFQKLHPGEKYYLTNIQAMGLQPRDVRDWSDDLWLFPYYVDTRFVPFDARPGGPAAAAWPRAAIEEPEGEATAASAPRWWPLYGLGVLAVAAAAGGIILLRQARRQP